MAILLLIPMFVEAGVALKPLNDRPAPNVSLILTFRTLPNPALAT